MPVEDIRPGMLVLAVSGIAAPFQEVAAVETLHSATALVRIRAGALADGSPDTDLLLPPATALLLDGALVAAGDLINGHGVLLEPTDTPVALVRVILKNHDAVLARGTAVETASPDPDAPSCAPRRAPDGTLRALLAWRAEVMGWVATAPPAEITPEVGSFRARLEASPMAPLGTSPLPVKPPF